MLEAFDGAGEGSEVGTNPPGSCPEDICFMYFSQKMSDSAVWGLKMVPRQELDVMHHDPDICLGKLH